MARAAGGRWWTGGTGVPQARRCGLGRLEIIADEIKSMPGCYGDITAPSAEGRRATPPVAVVSGLVSACFSANSRQAVQANYDSLKRGYRFTLKSLRRDQTQSAGIRQTIAASFIKDLLADLETGRRHEAGHRCCWRNQSPGMMAAAESGSRYDVAYWWWTRHSAIGWRDGSRSNKYRGFFEGCKRGGLQRPVGPLTIFFRKWRWE